MCASMVWKFALIFLTQGVNGILDQDVIPKSYHLKLVPFLENSFNFTGEVYIDIVCKFSTTQIFLQSKELEILQLQITRNGKDFPCGYETKSDILKINTVDYMAYNTLYRIHIKYQGQLNDDMIGFYRSSYKIGRQIKWMAITQLESNFARMVFPCFDEPRHRTPFTISVARYKDQTALSNMPINETSEEDSLINNRVWDTFETTPPMPTYLVAVIVCDFTSITSEDGRISVWARENAIQDGHYILYQSQLVLEQLEMYTEFRYNLPKLDLVAIPDFKAGAMENWGLTTYRERSLLYKKDTCSTKDSEKATLVVAHELAHQWFGDYVTPQWWSYVWLNEAFATYFMYYIPAAIEPSWRMDQFFVVDALQTALFADEVTVHHAMTTQVKNTAEIEEIFDIISYQKGGSVLRMFEHIVSSHTFRKTLIRYLEEGYHNGSTVTPDHLWDAFDHQAVQDKVKLPSLPSEIMKGWTTNRGYPLITVTKEENKSVIVVQQQTYKSPRSSVTVPDQNWIIPLTFTTQGSPNFYDTAPTRWSGFESDLLRIRIPLQDDEWVIFNIQQTGYYRVTYDLDNWNLLINQLHTQPDRIHVLNRAQLVDDSFSLAIDEKLSYAIAINLTNYLDNEFDMIPWFAAMKSFSYLYSHFEHTAIGNVIKEYLQERVGVQYKRLGFYVGTHDDHLIRTGRSSIVSMACFIGYPDCITKAKKLYEKYSDDLSKVPGDLKYSVYCTMLSYGNSDSVWNKLWTLYKTTDVAAESEKVLSTVGCINDDKLIMKILEKLISDKDNDIHKQNSIHVLRSVFQTSNGVAATLNFIEDALSRQNELNSVAINKIISIIKKIGSSIKSEDHTRSLKKMINDANQQGRISTFITNGLKNAYQEGITRIQMNKKRMEELKNAIEKSARPQLILPVTSSPRIFDKVPSSSSAFKFIPLFWLNFFTPLILYLKSYFRLL